MTSKRIEVNTSAGTLVAETSADPGAPGIYLFYIPKGTSEEIDIAVAEVRENPVYRKPGETNEDVIVFTYEDIENENYTTRFKLNLNKALSVIGEVLNAN